MLPIGTVLHNGTYRIEAQLGSGSFGHTYKVRNLAFDEIFAMKEFFMRGINTREKDMVTVSLKENRKTFDSQKNKFSKEALRLHQIKNAHITHVSDFFEFNGTAYYVMDFVDGGSLADLLKRSPAPLPEVRVMEILDQMLDALDAIHSASPQILHLDIKPSNIMTDRQGNIKLIDFGASKQITSDENAQLTLSTMCYTLGYAPTEQTEQTGKRIGPWTDFYALGGTLYNLLTLQRPPSNTDLIELQDKAFSFPDTVSEKMRQLIAWMMKPQRTLRPQSVQEIRDWLTGNQKDKAPDSALAVGGDEGTLFEKDDARKNTGLAVGDDEGTVCEKDDARKNTGLAVGDDEGTVCEKDVVGNKTMGFIDTKQKHPLVSIGERKDERTSIIEKNQEYKPTVKEHFLPEKWHWFPKTMLTLFIIVCIVGAVFALVNKDLQYTIELPYCYAAIYILCNISCILTLYNRDYGFWTLLLFSFALLEIPVFVPSRELRLSDDFYLYMLITCGFFYLVLSFALGIFANKAYKAKRKYGQQEKNKLFDFGKGFGPVLTIATVVLLTLIGYSLYCIIDGNNWYYKLSRWDGFFYSMIFFRIGLASITFLLGLWAMYSRKKLGVIACILSCLCLLPIQDSILSSEACLLIGFTMMVFLFLITSLICIQKHEGVRIWKTMNEPFNDVKSFKLFLVYFLSITVFLGIWIYILASNL